MLNLVFNFCFSALVVGSITLWWLALRNKKFNRGLITERETAGSPFGLVDVLVMFVFWIGGQVVALGAAAFVLGIAPEDLPQTSGDQQSWASVIIAGSQLIATLIAVGIFMVRYRQASVVGLQWSNLRADLRLGMLSFLMVIPAILILQWLLVQLFEYEHPTMQMLIQNANGLTLFAAWFSAVIVAPICEEIFFRGVLQSWLQRLGRGAPDSVLTGGWDSRSRLVANSALLSAPPQPRKTDVPINPYEPPGFSADESAKSSPIPDGNQSGNSSWISDSFWPILVTSVMFGLAHYGQGPAPISLFVFGVALGYIFRRTGSIVPCIVLHMMLNAFSMFWFTIRVFFGETEAAGLMEQTHQAAQVLGSFLSVLT